MHSMTDTTHVYDRSFCIIIMIILLLLDFYVLGLPEEIDCSYCSSDVDY